MSSATLTYDGLMTIPEHIVRSAHIQKGDQVNVRVDGETIVLERQSVGITQAEVVTGKFGRKVLHAPTGSPPMTAESVKRQLEELEEP